MKFLQTFVALVVASLIFECSVAGETKARRPLDKPDYLKAEAISRPSPRYPESRARLSHGGLVEVIFMVDKHGKPYDVLVTSSTHEDFEEKAVQALASYVYKPASIKGVAVDSSQALVIKFQMENAVPKVSKDFRRLYNRSKKAIASEKSNPENARKLLGRLKETPYLSSYALAYVHLLEWEYANKFQGVQERLFALDRVLLFERQAGKGGQFLVDDQRIAILQALLTQRLEVGALADAFEVYDELKHHYPGSEKPFESLIQIASETVESGKPFLTKIDISERGFDLIELLGTTFLFQDVEGSLEQIKLRCQAKSATLPFSDASEYQVPSGWGECSLQIDGQEGTKASLVQLSD